MEGQTIATMNDTQLVSLISRGRDRALKVLMKRYHNVTFCLAIRILEDEQDAEEVIQDTFFSVWNNAHTLREPHKVKSWLCMVARRFALMKIRARKGPLVLYLEPPYYNPQCVLNIALNQVIQSLPAHYYSVFMLKGVYGYPMKKVALVNGISKSCIRSRYFKARMLIQKRLKRR